MTNDEWRAFLDVYSVQLSRVTPTNGLKARNMTTQGNALGLRVAMFYQALKGPNRMKHAPLDEGHVWVSPDWRVT